MARKTSPKQVTATDDVELITVPKAAEILNVHRATVYRLLEKGKLPKVEVLGAVRIPKDRVRKFVNDQLATAK